ncbi:AAA family ATPase [Marinomonas mediterranea]|uniref:AAA family ATPase n=1 Tax=Marinomonas mediterranea TaxID=119864 RepID=UPI00234A71B6|nr:AAA family ATPase [Marinomonas mediterranea]WCN08735.1 AAA family ATPase [Marinomonas mediterranea]
MSHAVILIVGFPGSGKSTIARAIASSLGATYLDKDTICNSLTGLLLEQNGEAPNARDNSALYKEKIMPLEYQTLFKVANDTLSSSSCIVIDAPFISFFDDPDYIDKQRAFFRSSVVDLHVVEVTASIEVTKKRLIQRGEKRDIWKLNHWDEFSQQILNQRCCWKNINKFSFDNSSPEANTVALISQIKQHILTQDTK